MSFGEGDLHAQVDRLKDVNGSLCAEINRQERVIEQQQAENAELSQINHRYAERVRELESLVRDLVPFVCEDDGIDGIERRMAELGIGVGE